MLTLYAGGSALAGAVAAAEIAGGGAGRFAVGISLGLVLGSRIGNLFQRHAQASASVFRENVVDSGFGVPQRADHSKSHSLDLSLSVEDSTAKPFKRSGSAWLADHASRAWEETATAKVVWAGKIPAACYGPRWSGNPKRVRNASLPDPFESVSVVHASPQVGLAARKKAGPEV